MRVTVAHSPDSDDAFMFFGLASGAVKVDGIDVDQVLADIESLNRAAFEGRYEVTAVSFHAYAHLADRYALLPHGASMGDKYGPILVAREPLAGRPALSGVEGSLKGVKVGIPGRMTSAFLTLQLYDPSFDFEVIPFDEIQQAVVDGRVDAGLLIHEGQLTYQADGLRKIVDLGEWWFERTNGLPLPLGGNVIRRDLGPDVIRVVSRMLHDSIAHALSHRAEAVDTRCSSGAASTAGHGQVRRHADQLTLDYGLAAGRRSSGVRRGVRARRDSEQDRCRVRLATPASLRSATPTAWRCARSRARHHQAIRVPTCGPPRRRRARVRCAGRVSAQRDVLRHARRARGNGSHAGGSRSTAPCISSPPTTGRIISTAASRDGTAPSGMQAVQGRDSGVIFRHTSPDGDEGYPGTVRAEVTYADRRERAARRLFATADAPTVINLTQHSYFNLADRGRRHPRPRADDRRRPLCAGRCRPIPTGEWRRWPHAVRLPHAGAGRRAHR